MHFNHYKLRARIFINMDNVDDISTYFDGKALTPKVKKLTGKIEIYYWELRKGLITYYLTSPLIR